MDTDFANIEGIFKTNTDIVKKAITEIPPDDWHDRNLCLPLPQCRFQ
jgi:hypothetical protein